jgi:hypothetical protein
MGLQGMINDLVQQSDFPTGDKLTDEVAQLASKIQRNPRIISAAIFLKLLSRFRCDSKNERKL